MKSRGNISPNPLPEGEGKKQSALSASRIIDLSDDTITDRDVI